MAGGKRETGRVSWYGGRAAEDAAERALEEAGLSIEARRWRGAGGEIDLVARDGETYVFAEVKSARSHEEAAWRLGARQMARIAAAASEYLASSPNGLLSDARFDVVLVDGTGRTKILRNAFTA
ncbi:YraN family protein [Roseicyclus sp. F158]|uniref:UPF0102 protein RM543_07130 n=1 Tax=Tropicimonas omnivorans TaxID=3075590 RepID=A0ABU3DFG6_9RHOB|nr:YraN family protein [Roseicyclus sp. F158]MDT0682450.1 YraN family protein [Roseicyclus sp. F158]